MGEYKSFPDLLHFVARTGNMSVASLKDNFAKGCVQNGRYCASFRVQPELFHFVCLVKEGPDVKIVDTFIQERLEAAGNLHTGKGEEYLFTVEEYLAILQHSGVKCDGASEVYG